MSNGDWFTLIGIGIGVAGALFGWILSLHGRTSRLETRLDDAAVRGLKHDADLDSLGAKVGRIEAQVSNLDAMRADLMKLMMHLVDEFPRRGA